MQKVAYQHQKKQKAKGLKPKNVKEIKAGKGAKFVKASRGFTLLGLGLETADIIYDKEIQMSNMIDVGVTVVSCWYWPVGAVYLGVDVGSLIFTGNDIGYYIDDWYGKPIYEWHND